MFTTHSRQKRNKHTRVTDRQYVHLLLIKLHRPLSQVHGIRLLKFGEVHGEAWKKRIQKLSRKFIKVIFPGFFLNYQRMVKKNPNFFKIIYMSRISIFKKPTENSYLGSLTIFDPNRPPVQKWSNRKTVGTTWFFTRETP